MTENGEKRPWLAAALAVLYPGLGHVYLGLWWRAVVWSGMAGLTAAAFLPADTLGMLGERGLGAFGATFDPSTGILLVSVTALAAFDAYWHATRGAAAHQSDGATCPECGKGVDPELSFCQWCTADLE